MNKIKLTKELKCNWWLIGGFVFCIWVTFPFLFKALMSWMDFVGVEFSTFAGFGPIGDIYGSLNTLFTSATLAIVVYSTLLQRQANEDARKAMAEQLEQARNATTNQLTQARESLTQQLDQAQDASLQQIENAKELSKIELQQTREVTQQQLDLAQEAHDAQIRESRYAVFVSMFNALMALKQAKLQSLVIKNSTGEFVGFEIFNFLADEFTDSFYKEFKNIDELNQTKVKNHFYRNLTRLNGDNKFYDLGSFFLIYENLLKLIIDSNLDSKEKEYFRAAVRNSMSGAEQLTLFWMGAYSSHFKSFLKDSQLFSQFYSDNLMPFAIKFYDKSFFLHPKILMNWDKYLKQQNPA